MTKNIPTILVLLGATGDLVAKKIAPALWHLAEDKKLPDMFQVVGFSRRDLDDISFREHVASALRRHQGAGFSKKNTKKFLDLFSFVRGDFDEKKSYAALARRLESIDEQWRVCSNKLFYLAVPPLFYETIFRRLSSSGLTQPCSPEQGWTRIIVEKPFGKDAKTARALDELLARLFQEVQIYRIDHYLAKEMLQNIVSFRFSNSMFEQIWSHQFIEQIDIRLWEKIGAEDRGSFYDGVGALRDVGQNHLLQMLALVTMDHPASADSDAIRAERSRILSTLRPLAPAEIKKETFRAQYEGYRAIKGVDPESRTETFFALEAELDAPRWRGVLIRMESGKRMAEQKKDITVTFKHPVPCLCPPGTREHHKNKVVFSLEPMEGIAVHFWAKKPGLDLAMEERTLAFLLRRRRKSQYVEEYEKLLLDCIAGDQTLFVGTDEVRGMWKFIDPVIAAWRRNAVPLRFYTPDTSEAVEFAAAEKKENVRPDSQKREIGIIGLGKMGANISRRLLSREWRVAGYDRSGSSGAQFDSPEFTPAGSIRELAEQLTHPRIVWIMVPAGKPVDNVLFGREGIARLLRRGDTVIDGGNSFYKDTLRRAKKLNAAGIQFLDVGISGGPSGALHGASLMIGGSRKVFESLEYLFQDMSAPHGYRFFEGAGAGHFVKMIHNGIEYGMMQSLAEGFDILKQSGYGIDLGEVADVYNHGSVIESRLVGWLKSAFELSGPELEGVSGSVRHTGEGAWTVKTGRALGIRARAIEQALRFRIESKKRPSFAGKILSALRGQFGGHAINSQEQ